MSPPRSRRTLPVLLLLLELLLQLSRPCSGQMKVLLVSEKDQQDAFTRFTAGIARAQDDNDGFTIDVENRMVKLTTSLRINVKRIFFTVSVLPPKIVKT